MLTHTMCIMAKLPDLFICVYMCSTHQLQVLYVHIHTYMYMDVWQNGCMSIYVHTCIAIHVI